MKSPFLPAAFAALVLTAAVPALAARTLPVGLPLAFEPNRGQTAPQVSYLAHGEGYTLFLAADSATFELGRGRAASVIRMDLSGADATAAMRGEAPLAGTANYLIGADRSRWVTGLPTYARARADGIYRGIDVLYYGTQGRLEYDFVVGPLADPSQIRLSFPGARTRVAADGELRVALPGARAQDSIRFQRPVIYQEVAGARRPVRGGYRVGANRQVTFRVGAYDRRLPLIIDPVLLYSSYIGGSTQQSIPNGAALNAAGDLYVTGITNALDYPTTTGVLYSHCPVAETGATKCGASSASTAFVSKIAADGRSLVYSTYLGGSGDGAGPVPASGNGNGPDYAAAVAVDARDEAWIFGATFSNNFPITADALQVLCAPQAVGFDFGTGQNYGERSGCAGYNSSNEFGYGGQSLFLVRLNPTGTAILYGTFLGGTQSAYPGGIVLDAAGNVYLSGAVYTQSTAPFVQSAQYLFPTTTSAYQQPVANTGSAFVTEISADGHKLLYSTTFGGGTNTNTPYVTSPALANGHVVIGGGTQSATLPVTAGALGTTCSTGNAANCHQTNAFLAVFDPGKSGAASLLFSTYLNGASGNEYSEVFAVAGDSAGNVYAVGNDSFPDFPTTPGVLQPTCKSNGSGGPCSTYFVSKFTAAGALAWSTFYGSPSDSQGSGSNPMALVVDAAENVYVAGPALGAGDLPTKNSLQPYTGGAAFISEFSSNGAALQFGTFYGGSGNAFPTALLLDSIGDIIVTGYTATADLPLVNALQSTSGGGYQEGFFAKISGPTLPTYEQGQLTVPLLSIGSATYADVVVAPGRLLAGPTSSAPAAGIPVYTPANGQMSIPVGFAGTTQYNNVVITLNHLVSIGSVSGADTFDGSKLTIPTLAVGGRTYHNVVITIAALDGIGGGMPALAQDQYVVATNQLSIPAVEAYGRVYTNVVVTVGQVLSVNGG
jgi:hypothetical protein